ncbi:MAG: KH domain-containing protein [Desulfobacteraceae bacterium]|nr:KH domain-containing protein [Desulfobacteraceae bacterium]
MLVTDLVTRIVQALVDRPQEVEVSMIQGGGTMVLELRVAKDDIVKIIGRQGRTAQAMRTLIGAVAAKTHTRAVLEIIE